jgi:hypothetical protein
VSLSTEPESWAGIATNLSIELVFLFAGTPLFLIIVWGLTWFVASFLADNRLALADVEGNT